MIVKDPTKVKDEEITLEDVRRAEAIVERANRLLGRKTECHHYHGWNYFWTTTYPIATYSAGSGSLRYCDSSAGAATLNVNLASTSIVEAANKTR